MQTSIFEDTLQERFEKFHKENPQVYKELLVLTRQAHDRGRKKIGIGMLFEVLRWNRFIQTNDPDFKLNNNYRSRYARLIEEENWELRDIFETRTLKS